ncbi:MAG: four helix bundle protein [Chloroflexi bacterium]|nr:four helix bundle protein [Chloroflexota bacterium]MCI0796564.1 four helix bundle protein [Chloroflexota bacterium]
MRDFKNLKVWERSHRLTLSVYRASGGFPREEMYGLTSQMRRASASIAANIAEGCGRDSKADFARFLQIAAGSASELEYQAILARDLKLLDEPEFNTITEEVTQVKRMLSAFIRTLKADN